MQSPNTHTKPNCTGCKNCSGYAKLTKEKFIEKANEIHGNKYNYSKVEYKNNKTKVIIICLKHGEFLQPPDNHINQKNGCPCCASETNGDRCRHNINQFIEKAKEIHGDKYDYSKVDYKTVNSKVKIICPEHGEFMQQASNHINQKHGCPACKKQYSKMAINWLEFMSKFHNKHINHALNGGEYVIPNTRFKADGYCKETNTIYEFHGDYWHGNPDIYKPNEKTYFGKTFGELYEKTMIKEQQVKDMGFNLVTIWENDWLQLKYCVKKIQNKFRLKHNITS